MEPLYVDVEAGVIRCKWCKQHWKGATEVKVVNQHCKRSAFHKEKNRVLGIPGWQWVVLLYSHTKRISVFLKQETVEFCTQS